MDAGDVAHRDGRDDHASIYNFEASLGAWPPRTVSGGAPRIHGELLKLGFTISERTVSRYLPDRLTRPSQTWRTFLANHINQAFALTMTSSSTTGDNDIEASVLPRRPVLPSRDGRYASKHWALVDWPPSRESTALGSRVAQTQVGRRTCTRFSSGKDPPTSAAVNPCWRRMAGGSLRSENSISANERLSDRRPSDSEAMGHGRQALARFARCQGVYIAGELTLPSLPGVEAHI